MKRERKENMTLNEIAKKILNIDLNNIADPEYLKELVGYVRRGRTAD